MRPNHLLFLALAAFACRTEPAAQATDLPAPTDSAARVETAAQAPLPPPLALRLHVMSKCQFAQQFIGTLAGAIAPFGERVTLKVEYIGKNAKGQLYTLNGPDELAGDVAQLCAAATTKRWFEMVQCQFEDLKRAAVSWKDCAERLRIDPRPIEDCIHGNGEALARASFDRSAELGVSGSPTFFVADTKYTKPRTTGALRRAICAASADPKPSVCATIAPARAIPVTVLADARDPEGDIDEDVVPTIENPVIKELDYGTPAGKKLYGELGDVKLPIVLVDDAAATADPDLANFIASRRLIGKYRVDEMGRGDPVCRDDGGCKLKDRCALRLECRKEVKKKVELYTMSKCPYCTKVIPELPAVLDRWKKAGVDFRIQLVGTVKDGVLKSMHGDTGVEEDRRYACAMKHYAKGHKFLDYMMCREKDLKGNEWTKCTGSDTGIDAKVLAKCSEGPEGEKLLRAHYEYAQKSALASSPLWVFNDKHKTTKPRTADAIEAAFCEHNACP